MTIGVTTALLAIGLVACGSDSSGSSSSKATTTTKAASSSSWTASTGTEKLSGKVNDKGAKSIVGQDDLELEADDYYFKPTYVTVSPGQKVKVEIENEGDAAHTFTSSQLGVDQELAPGAKKTVTVSAPMTTGLTEFHCNFHGSMGMRGAFVVTG
jgi:plastocyanin